MAERGQQRQQDSAGVRNAVSVPPAANGPQTIGLFETASQNAPARTGSRCDSTRPGREVRSEIAPSGTNSSPSCTGSALGVRLNQVIE
jgi:hypothetical protein